MKNVLLSTNILKKTVMKKLVILILITLCGLNIYSQDSKILLGFEVSPTLAWLRGNSAIGINKSRLGYATGFSFEYSLISHFSLRSGLGYERKGQAQDISFTDENGNNIGTANLKSNYDYLVLPLLGSFSTNGTIKFFVNAGPFLGFLLSQKNKVPASGLFPGQTVDNYDNTKNLDLGISLGLGIDIPLGEKLLIELGSKFDLGLLDTNEQNIFGTGTAKTNSLGFQLGLKYKL
jgi:hypothetical protein